MAFRIHQQYDGWRDQPTTEAGKSIAAADAARYMKQDPELSRAEKMYYWNVIDRIESHEDVEDIRGMLIQGKRKDAYQRLEELDGGTLLQNSYAPAAEGSVKVAGAEYDAGISNEGRTQSRSGSGHSQGSMLRLTTQQSGGSISSANAHAPNSANLYSQNDVPMFQIPDWSDYQQNGNWYYTPPENTQMSLPQKQEMSDLIRYGSYIDPPQYGHLTSQHRAKIAEYERRYGISATMQAQSQNGYYHSEAEAMAALVTLRAAMSEQEQLSSQLYNLQYLQKNGHGRHIPGQNISQEINVLQKKLDVVTAAVTECYETYASIPVQLTRETLRNPIALQYSDLLSLRMARSDHDTREIKTAINALRQQYDNCVNVYFDAAGASWCKSTLTALENKLKRGTVKGAIVNSTFLGFPSFFENQAKNAEQPGAQLSYLGSLQYARNAHPQLQKNVEKALEVYDILDSTSGLFKKALEVGMFKWIKSFGKEFAKFMITELVDK